MKLKKLIRAYYNIAVLHVQLLYNKNKDIIYYTRQVGTYKIEMGKN